MLPKIPEDLDIPKDLVGLPELAAMYKRSVKTLRRAFAKKRIWEVIGERFGHDFTPKQQLIIFHLYCPPARYYNSYLWLEQNGYIKELLKEFGLDDKAGENESGQG